MARGVGGHGPANIMKHIKGITFPTTKEDIVNRAKNGEGPDTEDIVDVLGKIGEKEYTSPAEIMKEVGRVSRETKESK